MNEELLHRMAYAAKEFGESLWIEQPSAIIQFSVWTEHGVDEVVAGYTGERILAQLGHEDVESPDFFRRLRAEINSNITAGENSDRG